METTPPTNWTKTNCILCGVEFSFKRRGDKPDRKLCGNECKFKYQKINTPRPRSGFNKECKNCGNMFYVQQNQSNYKFCSVKCVNENKIGKPLQGKKTRHNFKFTCKECGVIKHNQQLNRILNAKFCSHTCRAINYLKSNTTKTKPESLFENILQKNNISYEYQYRLENKIYDFYIPRKKLLIEIDGIFWHAKDYHERLVEFEELRYTQQHVVRNDEIKTRIAIDNGFKLIRIWETDVETFNISELL
jgi:very-short-patch-repair endonuclease